MPKSIRRMIYPKLQKFWPEVCSYCQLSIKQLNIHPFDLKTGTGGLPLHHTNYNCRLDDIRFIRFMCHGCNHKSEFRKNELEKYNQEVSAAMLVNLDKHQLFLDWFSDSMRENHMCMIFNDVKGSGSYVSGANVKTVERWLEPLYSSEGPFNRAKIGGVLCIYLKHANIEKFPSINDYQDSFNEESENLPHE